MNFQQSPLVLLLCSICALLLGLGCARPTYLSSAPETGVMGKAGPGGCQARFQKSNACVDIQWEKRPTETEYGSFILTVRHPTSELLLDAESNETEPMKIVLWMPSMGHGSAPVKIAKLSIGVYRATNVFFSMKGDWEIRFQSGDDQAIYALLLP